MGGTMTRTEWTVNVEADWLNLLISDSCHYLSAVSCQPLGMSPGHAKPDGQNVQRLSSSSCTVQLESVCLRLLARLFLLVQARGHQHQPAWRLQTGVTVFSCGTFKTKNHLILPIPPPKFNVIPGGGGLSVLESIRWHLTPTFSLLQPFFDTDYCLMAVLVVLQRLTVGLHTPITVITGPLGCHQITKHTWCRKLSHQGNQRPHPHIQRCPYCCCRTMHGLSSCVRLHNTLYCAVLGFFVRESDNWTRQ